jgi:hypothetical protein
MKATVALHITMYFLPESPRWLVAKDRQEDALKVLARLHSRGDTEDLYVQAELAEIVAKIAFEKRHKQPSYFSLLFGDEWRRMWIGIGVVSNLTRQKDPSKLIPKQQFWQQVTGINV